MRIMQYLLLHPPANAGASGGHIYNAHMLDEARQCGFALDAWAIDETTTDARLAGTLSARRFRRVLWDSLLMRRIDHVAPLCPLADHRLLVHYLPSQNPLLDAERRKAAQRQEDQAIRCVRSLLTTGYRLADHLRSRYPGKAVFVCEPGVDGSFRQAPDAVRPAGPRNHVHLVTVANLLPAKGYLELFGILRRLAHLPWRWHIVGDETVDVAYADQLRQAAAASGLSERMLLHGVLTHNALAALLRSADAFAFPSLYEAYGMAVAEAAALGLPIVTSRVGDCERLVRNGVNGWVVEAGDWRAFERGLIALLADAAARRRMRNAGPLRRPRSWKAAFCDFRMAFEKSSARRAAES